MEEIIKSGFLLPEDLEKVDEGKGKGRKYHIKDIGAVDSVTSILDKGFPKAYSLIQWFIRNTPESIEAKRKASTERGTKAHSAFEKLAKQGFQFSTLDEEERESLKPIILWCQEHQPALIITEAPICYISNTVKTAGRIDLLCYMHGEKWLIDFKTGSDIYPSYYAQVGLYAKALDVKKAGILLLQEGKYKWKEVNIDTGFKAFQSAYFLANFKG